MLVKPELINYLADLINGLVKRFIVHSISL